MVREPHGVRAGRGNPSLRWAIGGTSRLSTCAHMGASFRAPQGRLLSLGAKARHPREVESGMNLIWIIVVVLIVLFVLGYFGRGRFRS